jgi:hypothetical protein
MTEEQRRYQEWFDRQISQINDELLPRASVSRLPSHNSADNHHDTYMERRMKDLADRLLSKQLTSRQPTDRDFDFTTTFGASRHLDRDWRNDE